MHQLNSSRKTYELRHRDNTLNKSRDRVKEALKLDNKFVLLQRRVISEPDENIMLIRKSQIALPSIKTPKNVVVTEPSQQT